MRGSKFPFRGLSSLKTSTSGFTLIEVILAMTILSSMMILVAISISNATKSKKKIQTEIEVVSALRDAMRIIRTDINLAYNHYDFEQDIKEQAKKKPQTQTQTSPQNPGGIIPGQPYPTVPPVAPVEPPPPSIRKSPATKFSGNENTLNFVTLNNGRMTANDAQADFIEVGYFLKNCKTLYVDNGRADVAQNSQGTNCLFRRVQKVIDSDVTKGGTETVLLENVSEFSLKYLIEGKLDWLKEWKADKDKNNIFPDAVEVTLAVEREFEGKEKKYSIQYVVPIHLPNNVKPLSGSSPTANNPQINPYGVTQ